MTTVQIQKTRNASTVTKTAIDQKQSLEVVQTMLHGGLSSLAYMRNFFAEKAFDEQMYEMSDRIHSYKDYAAGKLVKERSEANAPSTAMRILRRGRSKRVDMFLDWLEKGAFAALKAGHLRALQIYVHADPTDRQRVIETYTFTIKYSEDAGKGKVLAGLEMDGPGSPQISVQATNSTLQTLLRQIVDICAGLPDLPEKRFISMEVFYVPDLKKQYRPQGWVASTSDKLLFAQAEGWETYTETLKELSSHFHRSTLKVTSLIQPTKRALARHVPTAFPKLLEYGPSYSKQADIDMLEESPRVVEMADGPPSDRSHTDIVTPSTVVQEAIKPADGVVQGRRKTVKDLNPTPAPTSDPPLTAAPSQEPRPDSSTQFVHPSTDAVASFPSQLEDSLNTQASNVRNMKKVLKDMMLPEQISQGDTQTQALPHLPTLSESTESPSRYTVSPSKLPIAEPTVRDKPALSPTKASELERDQRRLRQHAHDLAKRKGRKTKNGEVVLCQCGYMEEEDGMVECTYCGTWQHLHCYGYTGSDDPRLPEDHTCYQCLLGDGEEDLLLKLQSLAMKRRGMHLAVKKGVKTQRDFATDLGLDIHVAGPVYQHLKNAGYILPATGSHKAGYTKSTKPLFVAVKEGADHEKMLQTLFDPLLHVGHHYLLPTKPTPPTTLTQRLLASQADNMPPPATPASALRKKNAMTPASGLDLRPSMTPFPTPSRPRQPQKRQFDDGEAATPVSTYKRLKSMQTQYLLDANGLPSSPADPFAYR
ncbi:hypothetical protein LTR36_002487 [Oleoguttula mirabilis]|uniref:HORMA domain-containing protein n=1 Tax=Oleoguttula mirabilis TaxID=1507867 RepID=A0AAV9JKU2_9PEZI|nr:hypothetical protein LTR36_002487 [Oleoguttula mirabilis]